MKITSMKIPFSPRMALVVAAAVMFLHQNATATTINLGDASGFAILGGTAVTFSGLGTTTVVGDVGVSPGTAITGTANLSQTGGTTHYNDAVAILARSAVTTAYNDAASTVLHPTTGTIAGSLLGGLNLGPGVYDGGALALTGVLTLTGGANDFWIFRAASSLTTASGSRVLLSGGADACNVFWQVTSSATLGANSFFDGTILASASITLGDDVTVDGRMFAGTGDVTLIHDNITVSGCTANGGGVPDTGSTLLLLSSGLGTLLAFRRRFFSPA
jgi:Ice-binding-like/VPDSG-CTERM motif